MVNISVAASPRPVPQTSQNVLPQILGLPGNLLLFLFLQALAWSIVPPLVSHALPINTAELSIWTHEPFIVNYKHPGLVTWVMWLAYDLLGTHLWVPYLVAQVFICSTYLFVFLLGRDMFGERRAIAGTLLLVGVSYFTLSAFKLNHNTVQMPFWAAFSWALWRVSTRKTLFWWMVAAAIAAAGLYGKFSTGVLLAFGTLWIVTDRETRAQLATRKPYLALALFLLLMVPLAVALIDIQFLPFKWIADESAEKGVRTSKFLLGQLYELWGLPVLAMASGLLPLGRFRQSTNNIAELPSPTRHRRFLVTLGIGPIALVIAMALFSKMRVEWTTPMFNLLGLLLVCSVPIGLLTAHRLRRLAYLACAASLVVLGSFAALCLNNQLRGTAPWVINWPATDISQRLAGIWQQRTGTPVKIVGGATWIASVAGLTMPSAPALYSRLDSTVQPSITPQRIAQDGMLVVWRNDKSGWQPTEAFLQQYAHGVERFAWSRNPAAAPVEINYAIVPPAVKAVGSAQ